MGLVLCFFSGKRRKKNQSIFCQGTKAQITLGRDSCSSPTGQCTTQSSWCPSSWKEGENCHTNECYMWDSSWIFSNVGVLGFLIIETVGLRAMIVSTDNLHKEPPCSCDYLLYLFQRDLL